MTVGKGFADRYLTHEETSQVVQQGLATLAGRRQARAGDHSRRHAHHADAG